MLLFFLLFESRGVVYALRYLASVDSRHARYEAIYDGSYDAAAWLNTHVQPRQRVALHAAEIYNYFVNSTILSNSESVEELQWLWERRDSLSQLERWSFYAHRGFTYVVVPNDHVDEVLALTQTEVGFRLAFVGRTASVVRIEKLQLRNVVLEKKFN